MKGITRRTFTFTGKATKADKIRGIKPGDDDQQVIIAKDLEEARGKCNLEDNLCVCILECNSNWNLRA